MRGARLRRPLTVAVLLAVVIAVAAVGVAKVLVRKQPSPSQPPAMASASSTLEFAPGDIVPAAGAELTPSVSVTGTLTPVEQAVVKTRAPGVLSSVLVREGQTVGKGQLLARMEDTEMQARLSEREADLAAAEAELGLAERTLQKQKALLDQGFISSTAFDTAQNTAQVARARADMARAQLAVVRKAWADLTLEAPIAGAVAKRHAEPGERLPADSPVLTIVSLRRLELVADVPASEIGKISAGQHVRVFVDGFTGEAFAGEVDRINPQAIASAGVVPVYVIVDNAGEQLRAGLFAHAEIVLSARQRGVQVPATAVREQSGSRYVYAIDDERLVRKPVSVAFVSGAQALITQGLDEGELVVAANLGELPEGARVRIPQSRP